MSTLQYAVLLTAIVVGGGFSAILNSDTAPPPVDTAGAEVAALRSEFSSLTEEISKLSRTIRDLQDSQAELADKVESVPVSVPAGEGGVAQASFSSADLKKTVAKILQKEREVKEEEREREREEERAAREQRREEYAALQEGPYDRYNVKINSLGNVLGMNDAQKQAYFELTQTYRTKAEEAVKALREKRAAEREANGEGGEEEGRRSRRGRDWMESAKAYRDAYSEVQKEFTNEVQGLFSAQQYETYTQLSRGAQSFSDRDMVRAPGEESSRSRFGSFGGRTRGGDRGGRGRGRGR